MDRLTGTELRQRQKFLEDLNQSLIQSKQRIENTLKGLSWTPEYIQKKMDSQIVQCPFDRGHLVPERSLEKHVAKCELLKNGCCRDDVERLLCDVSFFYEKSSTVIPVTINKETQTRILQNLYSRDYQLSYRGDRDVPVSPEQEAAEFTAAERVAIYDYVVSVAKEKRGSQKTRDDTFLFRDLVAEEKKAAKNMPQTHLEEVAASRDVKRRRQTYRAKNVHTTRKSYTEVIREVILKQVGLLEHNIREELEAKAAIKQESCFEDELKEDTETSANRSRRQREPSRESEHSSRRNRDGSYRSSSHRQRERGYDSPSYRRHRDQDGSRDRWGDSRDSSPRSRRRDRESSESSSHRHRDSSKESSHRHHHKKHKHKHKHKHRSEKD